jgi:hypothetical protein
MNLHKYKGFLTLFGILSVLCYSTSLLLMGLGWLATVYTYFWAPTLADEDMVLFCTMVCFFSVVFAKLSWILALFGHFMFIEKFVAKVLYLFVIIACSIRIISVMPYLNG